MQHGRPLRLRNFFVLILLTGFVACKKETISPNGAIARFSLMTTGPVCANAIISGTYEAGTALTALNEIWLEVNVTAVGKYQVSSSTVSGIRFADSGSFASTGVHTIRLKGQGTPVAPGTYTFQFQASTYACLLNISISPAPVSGPEDNDNLLFGNPSQASLLPDSANNYLMHKGYYSLSYSRDRGIPNWVSWHLYGADIGPVQRQDDFRADLTLPPGWYAVPATAYTGSGFDRGHHIPSADRTSNQTANSSTFLMTNMLPQAPNMNQKAWAVMEDSLRRYATGGYELYVVMGSYGMGGTGSAGFYNSINGGKVTVPAYVWKIALILPSGNNDISRVNENTRLIAVRMPNNNTVDANWKNYRVSVDDIEAATGYDLLSRLPLALQAAIESKVDWK